MSRLPSEQVEPPVKEGDLVAGKYRVERILGAGGMGVVVAARHEQLEQRVALKFLLAHAVTGVETVYRFQREAKAAARIHSEHVARVLDFGSLEDGVPYVVMEYLEGCDLADELAKRGPLPLDEAVGYMLQACEAFAEAHAAGIVHRDIKPSNLFLVKRGAAAPSVKVLDFGISKLQSSPEAAKQEAKLTGTRAIMGSPLYMSPEQMTSSKNVDARADVWSLGITLYELLANRPPFIGESVTELIAQVLATPVPPIRSIRPDVPPEFEQALDGALRKRREERHASMAAFAVALAPFGPRWAPMMLERVLQVSGHSDGATLSSITSGSSLQRPVDSSPHAFAETAASGPAPLRPVDNGAHAFAETAASGPLPQGLESSSKALAQAGGIGAATPPVADTGSPATWGSTKPSASGARSNLRGALLASGIGALVLAGAGVTVMLTRHHAESTVAEPANGLVAPATMGVAAPTSPPSLPSSTTSATPLVPPVPSSAPAPTVRAHSSPVSSARHATPLAPTAATATPPSAPSAPSDHVKATDNFGP